MTVPWLRGIPSKFQHRPMLFSDVECIRVFVRNRFGASFATSIDDQLVSDANTIVKGPGRWYWAHCFNWSPVSRGDIVLLDVIPISITVSSAEHIKRVRVARTAKNGVLIPTGKTGSWIFLPCKRGEIEAECVGKCATWICTTRDVKVPIRVTITRNMDAGMTNSGGGMLSRCCKDIPHL